MLGVTTFVLVSEPVTHSAMLYWDIGTVHVMSGRHTMPVSVWLSCLPYVHKKMLGPDGSNTILSLLPIRLHEPSDLNNFKQKFFQQQ